jgi:preprotein translocase subunit SecD
MIESLRARLLISFIVAMIGFIWVAPNFIDTKKIWWPTKEKLSYGLDIEGGLHLGLAVNIDSVMKEQSTKQAAMIKRGLKTDDNLDVNIDIIDPANVYLKVTFAGPNKPVEDYFDRAHRGIFQIVKTNPGLVEVQYFETYLAQFKKNLVEKAREVIANRVDEFGVGEPNITIQGEDRILVQLPGVKDVESAKSLINRTAKLEFMIVDKTTKPEEVQKWIDEVEKAGSFGLGKNDLRYSAYVEKLNESLKNKLPKNTVVRFQKAQNAKNLEAGKIPYLLHTDAMTGGDSLNNAYTTFDGQSNQPQVAFSFDDKGAKEFADLTTQYKGEFMAIVLDGVVQSAPYIKSAITGGHGVIEMGTSGKAADVLAEANVLSMVLKSGALPVNLEQIEERVVGPSLGADAIQKGKVASIIGSLLVFLFMIVYYRAFGVVASIAVIINLALLFAALASLKATLTLPGIAGIALMVGMAVDANVLVFERMRDELRKGASMVAAIRDGFSRAFGTILDSNVTTLATCVILMYYGTGPIRGFAVSLAIGLAASMFTAIFVSRALIELMVVKWKWNLKL